MFWAALPPLPPRRARGLPLPPIQIFALLLGLCLVPANSLSSEHQAYRTAYGCEGATLSIECDPGQVINVIRANYGRFSITICNPQGNTEWSVNCQSPHTHRVLDERCSGMPDCDILVSSEMFGDPCPGTSKYIEVHYSCGIATTTTTTSRPRPLWFSEQRPPVWLPPSLNSSLPRPVTSSSVIPTKNSFKPFTSPVTTTPTTTTSTTTTTTPSTTTISTSPTSTSSNRSPPPPPLQDDGMRVKVPQSTTEEKPVLYPSVPTNSSFTTSKPPVPRPPPVPTPPPFRPGVDFDVPWCAPTFTRGLYWNWTKAGDTAVLSCPGGATGSARRRCLVGEWAGPADLSDCRSAWLNTLETRASGDDAVLNVATDLAKVTGNKALYGGDLIVAARLIRTLSKRMMKDAAGFPEPHQRRALVTEFLLAALETGSALLNAGMAGPWGDLKASERRNAATELMIGLEEATFLLGSVLPRSSQAAHSKSHILASARVVAADGSSVHFPSSKDESLTYKDDSLKWVFTESVSLPPEAVLENSVGSSTRVIFLTYRHLEDLLAPQDEVLGARRRNKNITRMVNSRVVSASLGQGMHIQLSKPATLTFSLLRLENVTNPVCAFWDYVKKSWSDEGCYVVQYNRTHVTCSCNHLTNFAVIMEESDGTQEITLNSPIKILAYIGCFICIICLAGSLLVFTVFKSFSSARVSLQRHVCLCLLVAEIVFLAGIWKTELPVLCGVVAGILHYSVLAAFAWMFLEGLQVYLTISREIETDSLPLYWWHYVVAYLCPLVIVSTAAVADPFSFGTAEHCWLRSDNYFVFVLVGPALAILVLQVGFLGAAAFRTCRFNPDEALKTKEMARLASARSWFRSNVSLLCLMVLTWTLALLLVHQPSVPVAASFCVIDALLGIFIFIYYCLRNQKVANWCRPAQEEKSPPRISQIFRNVFATDKQTYSPNNNNSNNISLNSSSSSASESSSCTSTISPHPHHHPHHHQAISQALNQPLTVPAVQQYLPTLCHLGGLKAHAPPSQPPTGALLPEPVSMMGSRDSLRQTTGCVVGSQRHHLPMGSFHQSLPRHHEVHLENSSNHIVTTTATTTDIPQHLGTVSLSAPFTDEDASYKSFSRDSGHGGSEQEDSPRTPWSNHHHQRYANSLSNDLKNSYLAKMNNGEKHLNYQFEDCDKQSVLIPNNYSMTLSPSAAASPAFAAITKTGNRSHSPWNHTYMEIETDTEPVYEDIERERWGRSATVGSEVMQVSDLSDEDIKRAPSSDISRQSSRSYGDSRPLLPYLQTQQLNHHHYQMQQLPKSNCKESSSQFSLSEERLRDFNAAQMSRDLEHLQHVKQQLSRENLMTVAVLNGEQVVCRLSSPSHPSSPQSLPVIQENNRVVIPSSMVATPIHNGSATSRLISRQNPPPTKHYSEC